jgi:flagellum-specific ATP synthase
MPRLDAADLGRRLAIFEPFPLEGRVSRIQSGEIVADGPDVSVGMQCEVFSSTGTSPVRALVAAVREDSIVLVPFAPVSSLRVGDRVQARVAHRQFPCGDGFAGRAVNGLGEAIDGGVNPAGNSGRVDLLPVLDRVTPTQAFVTGLRAIDGLLTIGCGQRLGVFAASGVGKSRLIEQIVEQADCERVVVCQVGERGREVEALWRRLEEIGQRERCSLVAATSDEAAPMRARAVDQALALADYWRSRGGHVLLVVDSITRLAMALREIGLIAGEPPTARAYTPNVFRELPRIVERCGAARSGGSITAIFTVLCETDDADDPLVEVMKSLLDGHIVLSRSLAQSGHFPAVDILRSISRLFDNLAPSSQSQAAQRCRALLARYEESRILVESGMYKSGSDRELDQAIAARTRINEFLRQRSDESSPIEETRRALQGLAVEHV